MKTTTIKMGEVKDKDVFTQAVWKEPTPEQATKAMHALSRLNKDNTSKIDCTPLLLDEMMRDIEKQHNISTNERE